LVVFNDFLQNFEEIFAIFQKILQKKAKTIQNNEIFTLEALR